MIRVAPGSTKRPEAGSEGVAALAAAFKHKPPATIPSAPALEPLSTTQVMEALKSDPSLLRAAVLEAMKSDPDLVKGVLKGNPEIAQTALASLILDSPGAAQVLDLGAILSQMAARGQLTDVMREALADREIAPSDAQVRAALTQTRVDAAMRSLEDNGKLVSLIRDALSLRSIPKPDPIAPTDAQVQRAVDGYLRSNPVQPPAPLAPTDSQVQAAANTYLTLHPPRASPPSLNDVYAGIAEYFKNNPLPPVTADQGQVTAAVRTILAEMDITVPESTVQRAVDGYLRSNPVQPPAPLAPTDEQVRAGVTQAKVDAAVGVNLTDARLSAAVDRALTPNKVDGGLTRVLGTTLASLREMVSASRTVTTLRDLATEANGELEGRVEGLETKVSAIEAIVRATDEVLSGIIDEIAHPDGRSKISELFDLFHASERRLAKKLGRLDDLKSFIREREIRELFATIVIRLAQGNNDISDLMSRQPALTQTALNLVRSKPEGVKRVLDAYPDSSSALAISNPDHIVTLADKLVGSGTSAVR